MTRMSEAELREYRRRHPELFASVPPEQPAVTAAPTGYLPASASNGYSNEAAFQADAKERLEALGWNVQESLKGSARGGSVWYGKGWPDLQMYRPVRCVWFAELKQPGNKPSEAQLECHARLRACGFCVVVAWTLEQLLAAAEEEIP